MNSSLWRRLKYYGVGFLIGCIFVSSFFQTRGCSWTPENRVRTAILDRVITVNEVERAIMEKHNLTMDDIIAAIQDGKVDFKNSRKDTKDKVYLFTAAIKDKGTYKLYFTLPTESFISELHIGANNIKEIKNTKVGKGYFLHFPNDEYLIYPDSTAATECKLQALGMESPVVILKNLKANAYIDFEKSNLSIEPKAEHQIFTIVNKDTIGFSSIWYKNKIYIQDVQLERLNECDALSKKTK